MGDSNQQPKTKPPNLMFKFRKFRTVMKKEKPKGSCQRRLDLTLKLSYIFSLIPAMFLIPSAVFAVVTMHQNPPKPPTQMQGEQPAIPPDHRYLTTKFLLIAMLLFVISVSFLLAYLLILEIRKQSKAVKSKFSVLEPFGNTVVHCPYCDLPVAVKIRKEKGVAMDENHNPKNPPFIICHP